MLDYEKEKEKKAFKEMTRAQKWEHIKEYYRMPILLGIVGLFLVGWALNHYVINPPKKPSVNITFHAIEVSADKAVSLEETLMEPFPEYYDSDHKIEVITNIVGLDSMGNAEEEYASAMKMMAMMETRSIDLVVGDMTAMTADAYNSYLMSLTDVFTEEELEKIRGLGYVQEDADSCIIEVAPGDYDDNGYEIRLDPQPFFVDISGNQELRECVYGVPVYIGFASNAQHLEEAKALFWYFLTGSK